MVAVVSSEERKRIHPHKFTLWVAIGSIVMMFAGLTSAYIVKRSQTNWLQFEMPKTFVTSTVVVLLSSLTIHLAMKWFQARRTARYKQFVVATTILGAVFIVLQFIGFRQIQQGGVQMFGAGSNPAASFLGVIVGLHMLHILGGIVALIIMLFKTFNSRVKNYSSTGIEMAATYWHFVDVLWIYLFVFLMWL